MTIHNVQEAQAPFLQLQGCTNSEQWDEGVLLAHRLQSTALQVSASTLQLYRDKTLVFGKSWRSFDCAATTTALCVSRDTSVALLGTQLVETPRDVDVLLERSELLREFNGVVCSSATTGRVVGDGDVYTVSMCDLVEGALRIVVDNGGQVHWIRDQTGVGETLVLCVIALYAASSLAQHLSALVCTKAQEMTQDATVDEHLIAKARMRGCALNVLVCVVSTGVLVAMCETHVQYFVSQQDVDLYHVLVVYLGAEVVLLCLKETGPRDNNRNFGHQIGLSTTVLLLATLRLHNTFDTPFLFVLVGLFGTRTSCKVLQHVHDGLVLRAKHINLVSVLLDVCAWCWMLAYAIAQSFALQEYVAVVVNVVVALLLGLAMSLCVAQRNLR